MNKGMEFLNLVRGEGKTTIKFPKSKRSHRRVGKAIRGQPTAFSTPLTGPCQKGKQGYIVQ